MQYLLTDKYSIVALTIVMVTTCFCVMLFHADFRDMIWESLTSSWESRMKKIIEKYRVPKSKVADYYGWKFQPAPATDLALIEALAINDTDGIRRALVRWSFKPYRGRKFARAVNPLGDTAAFMRREDTHYMDASNRSFYTPFRHKKGGRRG